MAGSPGLEMMRERDKDHKNKDLNNYRRLSNKIQYFIRENN